MALETGTYINSLVATNPAATDGLAQADDHMRLIKSTIKATFPNITGAINATHTEINTVADGSTAATSTTLVDADRMVINDDGTMAQVALSDLRTYLTSNLAITSAMITDGTIATADIADNSITAAKLATGAAFVSGMIMPYAGTSAPTGWLMCFGQAVASATYGDLYTAIGTTYGGNATNFNLPDLRGRVIAGQDDMGGSSANRLTNQSGGLNGDTLGATGGAETHTITTGQLPSGHYYLKTNTIARVDNYANFNNNPYVPNFTNNLTAGGNQAHNNVQPTIILNYIIKT